MISLMDYTIPYVVKTGIIVAYLEKEPFPLKTIEHVGKNYSGRWNRVRNACRGIVLKDGMILMTRESLDDQYMIPGGGMEQGETWSECAAREVAEETGYVVDPYECVLEIDEYYEEVRYITRYYLCSITGQTDRHLTEREIAAGSEPVWMDAEEMTEIFSHHEDYAANEMKRGLYQREYSALTEILHSRDGGIRRIDDELELVPYYPAELTALKWYQDPQLCKQVDNIDHVYDIELLRRMYGFLCSHGECYYIRYNGELVGDCSLRDSAEIAIVVCREHQNRHIGRRCVEEMIKLAREKGYDKVTAQIYPFNEQSRRMFRSAGFVNESDDIWEYEL